ncbi:hypothetical protein TELCIR_18510, partial [Teladorsagia circumcincta]
MKLYGDVKELMREPECALVLSNHQSDVDWAVAVMLAARQGPHGNEASYRVMVKHVIHFVPLFGWYVFQGIPEFKNVLSPRVGGIFMSLERLETLDAVYDVTIGYGQTRLPKRRGLAPNMFEFTCGGLAGRTLSIHVKRHSAKEMRMSRKELQEWTIKAYQEKDKLLESFYETGEFPEPVSLNEPSVSIYRTLPPTLCFVAALVAPFYVPA